MTFCVIPFWKLGENEVEESMGGIEIEKERGTHVYIQRDRETEGHRDREKDRCIGELR